MYVLNFQRYVTAVTVQRENELAGRDSIDNRLYLEIVLPYTKDAVVMKCSHPGVFVFLLANTLCPLSSLLLFAIPLVKVPLESHGVKDLAESPRPNVYAVIRGKLARKSRLVSGSLVHPAER